MNEIQEPSFEIGKAIWMEDDALPPDAETLRIAWKRIFGEILDYGKATDRFRCDELTAYLMPNGYIAVSSYRGNCSINEVEGDTE